MSRTDRHRPYQVRLDDPAEAPNIYRGWDGHPWLLNAGCLNVKCSCKGTGYPDGKRATTRRRRHAARTDILERLES